MIEIYLYLGLLSASFGLFGYFLHAFYGRKAQWGGSAEESEEFRQAAAHRPMDLGNARDEFVKARASVQSLEYQLRQHNDDMENLRRRAENQHEEIRQLQKETESIREALIASPIFAEAMARAALENAPNTEEIPMTEAGLSGSPEGASAVGAADRFEAETSAPRVDRGAEPAPTSSRSSSHSAAWTENLDNILSILKSMEKEVPK